MEVELLSSPNHPKEIKSYNELSTKMDQSIRQIIKSEGFIKYEIDKRVVASDGSNFLSTLHEINVKGKTKDGDKEIHIFVKLIINIKAFQIMSISDVYNHEIFVYKELSKIYTALQENANVPAKEKYKMVKFYDESNTETIIMENLAKSGFTTYHRMDVIPIKFAERSVKELAKFHALSIVLREKKPEYFDTNIKSIKYPINFTKDWAEVINMSRDVAIDYVDDKFKDKIEKAYKDLVFKYAEYQNEESIKLCLCHGDYKPNNILVKTNGGEIQDIMPVDYQLIHYGCPVFDFLYFIFLGTDKDFRKAHMSNLKDIYYETISTFLKYFGLDANVIYCREEFDKVYNERLDYGLIIALALLPYVFASEDHVPDLSKEQSEMSFKLDERFRDRIRGVIEDFVEWGYI